jgi:riboflavin biosynthesis pyrimidine reductase
METLAESFGVETLLLEAVSTINVAFLKVGLIDEISVLMYPGSMGLPACRAFSSIPVRTERIWRLATPFGTPPPKP